MHYVRNFKSFENAEVDLLRPVTYVVGPNGSGKTNLIEAVELLSFIASGQPLHEVSDFGRGGRFEVRGGLQGCARRPDLSFTLGFRDRMRFFGESEFIHYVVEVDVGTPPKGWPGIVSEVLEVGQRTLFSAARAGESGLLKVSYDNFKQGPNKPGFTIPAIASVLAAYPMLAVKNAQLPSCVTLIKDLSRHLGRSAIFDPNPKAMRDYDRIGNSVLLRDGTNISAVLFGLAQGTPDEKQRLARIIDRIRELPEEPFADLGFETTKLGDVMVGFRTEKGGPLLDARLLSDGTLRALAVLTALETAEPSARLIVEEFDNGLHPSRIRMLCEAVAETAARRKVFVLVTTHNPVTLDRLGASELDAVLVCHWDKARRSARLTPLRELPRADELLERGRLGDLVTRKVIDDYLTPESDTRQRQQVEAWLESLPK